MRIDFVKTLEASAPYTPGTVYFESATGLIKVGLASNQYRVYGGVRDAEYDSSTDTLTIINGAGEEIEIDFSQFATRGLPDVDSSDNGKILLVENGDWDVVMPSVIYTGGNPPASELGNDGDVYLQNTPTVVYQTDGSTGLLGHNNSSITNNWQLENLDLTPFSYIKCYFKASTTDDTSKFTPAVVVTIPLDTAAAASDGYYGGIMTALPFNRNREYMVTCVVDLTKTKFQVLHQNTLWDVTASDANSEGRYLYKIEGYA